MTQPRHESPIPVFRQILDYPNVEIEEVRLREEHTDSGPGIVVRLRPLQGIRYACSTCGRVGTRDGKGVSSRRWRDNDLWGIPVFLECDTVRTRCPHCGIRNAGVPWAWPRSRFTRGFEREVARLGRDFPGTTVAAYKGIDRATVLRCMERVRTGADPEPPDPPADLRHILVRTSTLRGKRGRSRDLTAVIQADRNRLIWMGEGSRSRTFETFCRQLTPPQRAEVEWVAGEGAGWFTRCVREYFPQAEQLDRPSLLEAWAIPRPGEDREG